MRFVVRAIPLATLAAAACGQMSGPASIPPGSRHFAYQCTDGTRFGVLMGPAGDQAKLELGGVVYELKQIRSASGAKFSDGTTIFWSKGREATIERGGKVVHRDCKTSD
jgi:membrane-bound inhibitor of C-type lysozyme